MNGINIYRFVNQKIKNFIKNKLIDLKLCTHDKYDICYLCLDKTNTSTQCNHYICKDCFNELFDNIIKCPICRCLL